MKRAKEDTDKTIREIREVLANFHLNSRIPNPTSRIP